MKAENIEVLITLPNKHEYPIRCTVSTAVEEHHDPLGTGDSPTEYTVEITDCDPSFMRPVADDYYKEISQKAVKEYKG